MKDLQEHQEAGGLTVEDLCGFDKFLEQLETENRMRQCFKEVDKEELKGKSWKDVLCEHPMVLGDGTKQIAFVSVRECERFGSNLTPKVGEPAFDTAQ